MPTPAVTLSSDSPEATLELGVRLGQALTGGEVIGLVGPLGAGKTRFVKGVIAGAGAGYPTQVTSPTFVLMNEYAGRVRVYHIDAYRVALADELSDLGIDDVLRAGGCVLIEWADRVAHLLPDDRLTITLEVTGPSERTLSWSAAGPAGQRLAGAFE